MRHTRTQRGFTLIELLIVVSIISILSSITIATLGTARDKARNADRNEIARQYVIAFGLYQNTYGSYPTGGCSVAGNCNSNANWVCLGNAYPSDRCFVIGEHQEDATVNDQIKEFIPGLPSLLDPVVTNDHTFTGIAYGCTDSSCKNYSMSWILEGGAGNNSCYGGATKVDAGAVTICTFSTDRTL